MQISLRPGPGESISASPLEPLCVVIKVNPTGSGAHHGHHEGAAAQSTGQLGRRRSFVANPEKQLLVELWTNLPAIDDSTVEAPITGGEQWHESPTVLHGHDFRCVVIPAAADGGAWRWGLKQK